MKTSLIIDDHVMEEARKESPVTGKTISEIISYWARLGRNALAKTKSQKRPPFKAVDLGKPLLNLSNRNNWMEDLDNDRD